MMIRTAFLTAAINFSFIANAAPITNYETQGLNKSAIKRSDIDPLLTQFTAHPAIEAKNLGKSYLGQPIDALYIGSGPIKVMMWSQMHGDENTATAALMDFLSYIVDEKNAQWRASWQDKISLMIIPMINPDGAEQQTRYNAQGIDLNRDAKAQRTLEGKVLMSAAKQFTPHFGFNLHDQNAYYGAGPKGKPATISVLAPAYNNAREINKSRGNAMQLIAHLRDTVEQNIPGHLAKYNDSYSYRSFGDTFSEMGISTILIESGAYEDDPHRQVARKLNRIMYKEAIDALVSGAWQQQKIATYNTIPFNESDAWVDLLIDDVNITSQQGHYAIDIAINNKGQYPRIDELGDISSIRQGFTQLDASELTFDTGSAYSLKEPLTITNESYRDLLKTGYSCFSGDFSLLNNQSDWLSYSCTENAQALPARHAQAAFILKDKQQVKYAVLGSKLVKL